MRCVQCGHNVVEVYLDGSGACQNPECPNYSLMQINLEEEE